MLVTQDLIHCFITMHFKSRNLKYLFFHDVFLFLYYDVYLPKYLLPTKRDFINRLHCWKSLTTSHQTTKIPEVICTELWLVHEHIFLTKSILLSRCWILLNSLYKNVFENQLNIAHFYMCYVTWVTVAICRPQ